MMEKEVMVVNEIVSLLYSGTVLLLPWFTV